MQAQADLRIVATGADTHVALPAAGGLPLGTTVVVEAHAPGVRVGDQPLPADCTWTARVERDALSIAEGLPCGDDAAIRWDDRNQMWIGTGAAARRWVHEIARR
jgi:hypothetical protein